LSEHPTDDLLSAYAHDPSPAAGAAELEAHLEACPPCQKLLNELRAIEALLGEEDSWQTDPVDIAPPPAVRALSAMAAHNRREDAEAEAMLSPLLNRFIEQSSGAFIWADIGSNPAYYTAGVVRKLADAADKAQYSAPRRALILAETASVIVGMLSTTVYTPIEIAALRGVALKQQANVNRQLGRFQAALEALSRAERAYRELPRPELDLASITFIRGTIHFHQHNFELAAQHAEESAAIFARLGQTELYLRSRHLQGGIAFEQRELGKAQSIFDSILAHGEATGDLVWIARETQALGNCYLERGELSSASLACYQAMHAFRDLGILSEEIRCRWGCAVIVQREGHYRTAIARLRAVREEFVALGGVYDAALVTLDVMETFLLLEKPRDVQQTAGNIVKLFKDAGVVTGALTAADYLKQAAAMRNVTPSLISYIRRYFRRVDVQPDLAFVPPSTL
jgi:tetratricopeptide (TPR) repeat protein